MAAATAGLVRPDPAVRASALNGAWVATSSSAAVRSQRAPRRWL